MDFEAAGLLDGLEGGERAARAELLQRLADDGATLPELQRAVAEDRLSLLLVERRLGGRYTAAEIERHSGVPAEILLRMRRVLGLPEAGPDDRVFSEEDIASARSTRLFLDAGFSLESVSELSRVLGESMSRVAASVGTVFAETFLRPGDTEHDVAQRFDALAEQLTPAMAPVLVGTFSAHLRENVHRARLLATELETGRLAGEVELSVCFADLVGFTRLGGELEVHELGTVAGRLAELAGDVVEPPVRLIKTIGDAAMFVSGESEPLVRTALKLLAATEEADLPSLRAGIACGPAAQRGGDWFGHSVNLASRVTGVARPDSVLCTQVVRDAAPDAFEWSFAGRFRLKGVDEHMPLHRPRPPAAEAAGGEEAEVSRSPKADRRRRRASR